MAVQTLNDIYLETLKKPRAAAFKYKKDGSWRDITVPEFEATVRNIAGALRWMGVKTDDRVAILSENRPEWAMTDVAVLATGAVSVPIYPTLTPSSIQYILNDSGTVVLFVSNKEQLDKIESVRKLIPSLRRIVVFDPLPSLPEGVTAWDDALRSGAEQEREDGPAKFTETLRSRTANDLATIVYTSGTTGNPKGAMLTHGNVTSNVVTCVPLIPLKTADVVLNILPLSHILERMVDFCYMLQGATIAYAESVLKVADNMQELHPEVFAAVPRLFEKMKERILNNVAEAPPIRQKIFHWALGVGAERLPYMIERKPLPGFLAIKSAIAQKLVFSKILARLGGRVRFAVSGGAPLSAELAAFFTGAGLDILEGYGLTETSPVIAFNTLDHRRLGTVGRIIAGVEVQIAADGEILTRGPNVMKGYFNAPDATAAAIDPEGWFHTGDIGHVDGDGFLHITDRKKDLIINAYGKNIAPQPIENLLKTSPFVATPVLIGDRRKFVSLLFVPNFEALQREAKALGVSASSNAALVADPKIVASVQKEIDRFNATLDKQEKIRRFTMLPQDFTIEGGEITPSLKVKRRVVDEKYKSLIDAMYVDEETMA
ncbi:MAG: long-chain fatty acid--CoA ligase [Acidobacteria bacterium]|nr:long-chain fatty acid--CoA ligase [Acidobacteriota bacterium]